MEKEKIINFQIVIHSMMMKMRILSFMKEIIQKEKTGFWKIYTRDKVLIYEGKLLNGKKHLKGKLYDEKGNLKAEGDFIDDQLDQKNGLAKEYANDKSFIEIQYQKEPHLEQNNIIKKVQ